MLGLSQVSTKRVGGAETNPFRGFSAAFRAVSGWTGSGKSLLLENLGAPLIIAVLRELHHLDPGQEALPPALSEALRYVDFAEDDLAGFKESGSAAYVANILQASPPTWFIKMIFPESDEWVATIEAGKSPTECAMWTKFWDVFSKLAKGTGVVDVSRARFAMALLLMIQPDVFARLAKVEGLKKNGLFGRISPIPFTKEPFDFKSIIDADYDSILRGGSAPAAKVDAMSSQLLELAKKVLMASFVALEFPPNSITSEYDRIVQERQEAEEKLAAEAAAPNNEGGEEELSAEDQAVADAVRLLEEQDWNDVAPSVYRRARRVQAGNAISTPQAHNLRSPHVDDGSARRGRGNDADDDTTSETTKTSSSSGGKVVPQLTPAEQEARAADELQVMLPRPPEPDEEFPPHNILVGMMSRFDAEYHLQGRYKSREGGRACVAASGKAVEHLLRWLPSLQCLKNGIKLFERLKGARRMPMVTSEGRSIYLKMLMKTSLERTDLELGSDWLAGAAAGVGLVPTVDAQVMRLGNLLTAVGLKTSYEAVLRGVEGAAGPAKPPSPEVAQAMMAQEAVPVSLEVRAIQAILQAPYFIVVAAEISDGQLRAVFPKAAKMLEDARLGFYVTDLPLYVPSRSTSAGILHESAGLIRQAGRSTFFVKWVDYSSNANLWALANLGADVLFDYNAIFYYVSPPLPPPACPHPHLCPHLCPPPPMSQSSILICPGCHSVTRVA